MFVKSFRKRMKKTGAAAPGRDARAAYRPLRARYSAGVMPVFCLNWRANYLLADMPTASAICW